MPQLTKTEIAELTDLDAQIEATARRLESDLLEQKERMKKRDALLAKAKSALLEAGKTDQTRFGVRFRIVESLGRVAWKTVCEELKGKEWCQAKAAEVPRVQSIKYEIPK